MPASHFAGNPTACHAARVTYVQVAQPATADTPPSVAHKLVTLGGLALAGSLGLSLLVALVLESCFPLTSSGEAAPSQPVAAEPRFVRWVDPDPVDHSREARAAVNGHEAARAPAYARELGGHLREWQGHFQGR